MHMYPNPNALPTTGMIEIKRDMSVKSAMSIIRATPLKSGEMSAEGSGNEEGVEKVGLTGVEAGEGWCRYLSVSGIVGLDVSEWRAGD